MARMTFAKRIARMRTRGRLVARECIVFAPLRRGRHRAAIAALLMLACVAHWLARVA